MNPSKTSETIKDSFKSALLSSSKAVTMHAEKPHWSLQCHVSFRTILSHNSYRLDTGSKYLETSMQTQGTGRSQSDFKTFKQSVLKNLH